MLCNKLPQTQKLKTTHTYLNFCALGVWAQLPRPSAEGLSQGRKQGADQGWDLI